MIFESIRIGLLTKHHAKEMTDFIGFWIYNIIVADLHTDVFITTKRGVNMLTILIYQNMKRFTTMRSFFACSLNKATNTTMKTRLFITSLLLFFDNWRPGPLQGTQVRS